MVIGKGRRVSKFTVTFMEDIINWRWFIISVLVGYNGNGCYVVHSRSGWVEYLDK